MRRRDFSSCPLRYFLRQPQQRFAQHGWLMHNKWQIEYHQVACHIIEVVILGRKHRTSPGCGRKRAIGCRNLLPHHRRRYLKLYLNVKTARSPAVVFYDIRPAIEVLIALKRFCEVLDLLDAVQAKCAIVLTQAAVTNQVPVPLPAKDAIWLDLTLGDLVSIRTIVDGYALTLRYRFAQVEQ